MSPPPPPCTKSSFKLTAAASEEGGEGANICVNGVFTNASEKAAVIFKDASSCGWLVS